MMATATGTAAGSAVGGSAARCARRLGVRQLAPLDLFRSVHAVGSNEGMSWRGAPNSSRPELNALRGVLCGECGRV
jgi:hypothetical protein